MHVLARKLLLWISFIFIYKTHTITLTLAQPDFIYYFCNNDANYTLNSTYRRNLNTTLSALPTTNTGFGFFNHSTAQPNDRVNSIALCRGDVTPDVCRSCLNDSIVKLPQICPNQMEAIGYYDYCLLKYSNQTLLFNTQIRSYMLSLMFLLNTQNVSNVDRFNGALRPLIDELRGDAASGGPLRKFASGNATGPDFTTIYALVQCTPDLTEGECSDCLEDSVDRFAISYSGKIGGQSLLPMCRFRYEIYRFFNGSTLVIPPPPSSAPPPPILLAAPPITPPPPGKKTNTTIVIIVIVIVTLIIIIASICIFIRLRKKKQQMPPTQNIETEIMDISTAESLQFNFNIVRAATNDFSEDNKLGQGGFGPVYKGKLGDGQEIAVKRLARDSGQGGVEFKNEVLLVIP